MSRELHCLLVVDANILIRDFWWEGGDFRYLLAHLMLGHRLIIPEIALLEARAHLVRRAEDILTRLDGQASPAAKLLANFQRFFKGETVAQHSSPEDLGSRYEKFIRAAVESANGLIVPTPKIELEEIVRRSIRRARPFTSGDKGFRDTLIWYGILELVKEFQHVSFVSSNTNDFAGPDGNLHTDLDEEVMAVLPEHKQFRFFKSLYEFIAVIDEDGEATAEAFKYAILQGGCQGFVLEDWLAENIEELSRDIELDGVEWAGMPHWAENPILVDLEEVVAIDPSEEQSLGNGLIELFCDFAIVGTFQCSVVLSSWKIVVPQSQVVWVNEESSDLFTAVGVRAVGTYTLRLVYDIENRRVHAADLAALQHDFRSSREVLAEVVAESVNG